MKITFHIGRLIISVLLISGAKCGDKILLMGGITNGQSNYSEVLSPDKVQPTESCSMPGTPNYRGITVPLSIGTSLQGLISCGGHPQTADCWLYRSSWAKGPSLPQPRRGGSMSSVGTTAFYIGGRNRRYKKTKTIYKYNTPGGWTDAGQSLSEEREYHCSVILQMNLYVVGGANGRYEDLATVEKFRIRASGSLDAAPSPPSLSVARRSHACAVFGDSGVEKIIVAGGFPSRGSGATTVAKVETVEVWWPGRNSWTKAGELPHPRFAFSLTALPHLLVLAGGQNGSGETEASTLISSNNGNLWMPGPALKGGRSYHSAVVMDEERSWCYCGIKGPTYHTARDRFEREAWC